QERRTDDNGRLPRDRKSIRHWKPSREKHLPAAEILRIRFARMDDETTTFEEIRDRKSQVRSQKNRITAEFTSAKSFERSIGLLERKHLDLCSHRYPRRNLEKF